MEDLVAGAAWTLTVANKSVAKAMALWKEIIVRKTRRKMGKETTKQKKCRLYSSQQTRNAESPIY